jgi:hypothetical protein
MITFYFSSRAIINGVSFGMKPIEMLEFIILFAVLNLIKELVQIGY